MSGSHNASVTRIASRRKSQRGAGDPRDDRPGRARDDNPDDRQLGVVRELEVRVATRAGEDSLPDGDQDGAGGE